MKRGWASEGWLAGILIGAGAFVGLLSGAVGWGVAGALAIYTSRHLLQIHRLGTWLARERGSYPPEGNGVWTDVYARLNVLHRVHRERRRQTRSVLLRLQRSTRAIPDALVLVDEGFSIEWVNPAAARMLGVSTPRDQGQRIENLVRHPSVGPFLRAGNPDRVLMLRSPANPGILLELRTVAFADRRQLIVARDATERERVDTMRRDFVANVSHELRTPLTVLSGYLENLERYTAELPERWRRPVASMNEQATRMRRLVEDLLLLARVEASTGRAERETVDVPALVQVIRHDAVDFSEGRAHHIKAQADRTLQLRGVQSELHAAFMNLVGNAVMYTPPGGNIDIRWFGDEGSACFEVRDDGEGIAPEHLSRLTERFYRVDRGRSRGVGGTGLGLAIVKHILENHGGVLEVESTEGKGSVFRCRFDNDSVVRVTPPLKVVSS